MSKPLKTKIICWSPPTVYYPVPPFSDENTVRRSISEALEVIADLLKNVGCFNLLLDFRAVSTSDNDYSMAAHRAWVIGFRDHGTVKNHAHLVAVVGNDSPKFRAEKEFMDSERVRFLTGLHAAYSWLGIPGGPLPDGEVVDLIE